MFGPIYYGPRQYEYYSGSVHACTACRECSPTVLDGDIGHDEALERLGRALPLPPHLDALVDDGIRLVRIAVQPVHREALSAYVRTYVCMFPSFIESGRSGKKVTKNGRREFKKRLLRGTIVK